MRLLECHSSGEFSLTKDFDKNIPDYAILSHSWGDDDQEVNFNEMKKGSGKSKAGYQKIRFCGEQAARDGLRYFWVDTCCIDKSDPIELQKSINSMFRWYENSVKCYVYLTDVCISDNSIENNFSLDFETAFRAARWFTRGWTLQELLAPSSVEFFSSDYKRLGDKFSLERIIHERTGIPVEAFQGYDATKFSVDERVSWIVKRETKHEEDMAYSLLGIFGVFLPLLYGEGRENALRRLLEEVNRNPDIPLASIFSVPFRRDPDFVNRNVLLKQIHQKCAVPGSWTALVGLGGVGKSQLAIEYTYQIREQSQKTWVFWVHASNAVRFEQGYRDIADRLNISGRGDPKANIFTLVHNYLHDKLIGQWRLILDNIDDASFLLMAPREGEYQQSNGFGDSNSQPLLSFISQCQNGSILITTRSRSAALKLVEESDIVKVDPMEDSVALTLLEKKLGVQGSSGDFAELTAVLEFMPLAIVQAAAYLSQRAPRCSVREYLEQFQKSDHKKIRLLQNEAGHLRRDWEANNSILITWQISFDYLRLNRPPAADLLSLMSFFDRQGIPEALLKIQPEDESSDSDVAEDSEEDIISEASQDDQFEASVNALREFSFISVSVDGTTFEMHRLVQLATQKWLEASAQLEKWRQQYIKNLYTVFPIGEHEHWGICQSFFPHAKSAITQKPQSERSLDKWASLLYNAAWYAWRKGNIADAEIMAIMAMKARKKLYDLEHEKTVRSMGMVGLVYNLGGRWKDAEDLNVQVMEIRKRVLGQEHPDTLKSMNNLASTYQNQGRWKDAEDLNVQVVEIRKRVLGQEHPDTVNSMNNLASTYQNQGRWKDAEELNVQVIEMSKRVLGQGHPDTLRSMNNLAATYENQGRWKDAENLNVQVIEMSKKVLGQEHPDTLISIGNLALTYQNQGRWKDAEDLNVQVIEISKRVLGQEHPDMVKSMNNLVSTYQNQGRWKDAEELNVQVIEMSKKVLGQEHPDTLISIGNLALTYQNQGRREDAENLNVQVIEMSKRVLGQEHPDTVRSMNNLASIYWDQGRWKEAEALEVQVMEISLRVLGQEHPDTLTSMANLASTYCDQGRWKEAEALEVQVIEIRKRVLGQEHPDTLTSMNNLAFTWKGQGKTEEALALMEECLRYQASCIGIDHPDAQSSLEALNQWRGEVVISNKSIGKSLG